MPEVEAGTALGPFVLEEKIGEGAFASVWRARHTVANRSVAIKLIEKSGVDSASERTRMQREIALLKRMRHPFIAEFFWVTEDTDYHYLVMELAPHGNLLSYINSRGRLSEELARRYFTELIAVLDYLHNQARVAHRDIKCENLLLDAHNNIRVIDFGLSNVFTAEQPSLQTACGSPAYVAPEIIQGKKYSQVADVWSCGVVLFAMCAGNLPFDDKEPQRLLGKIVFTEPEYPATFSPALVDLLGKMLCKDPGARITVDGVKNHPWFSQTGYWAMLQEAGETGFAADGAAHDTGIDHEIIAAMTALGLDCRELPQLLLDGQCSDLTALYAILRREKMSERNKDLFARMPAAASRMKPGSGSLFRPKPQAAGAAGKGTSPLPRGAPPVAASPSPIGPKRLSAPVGTACAGRRLSRPQAMRMPVAAATNQAAVSHETP
jgi:tRNA A-37 threonylcarbamoyl transferase component Bud32